MSADSGGMDALLPPDMAMRAETVGARKAAMDGTKLFILAILAGAFIALGAVFATTVGAGAGGALPFGVVRLAVGVAFSLGLVMVVVGGAELFTGNTLVVMAWAGGTAKTRDVLRSWAIVYVGNFVGALGTAALVFAAGQYTMGGGAVGASALAIAQSKSVLRFFPALASGVLCNALVCLAVWMCFSARSTVDKIVAIVPPIAAFVAAGFEHCVANMYFLPVALLIKAGAPASFWTAIGKSATDYPQLGWESFLVGNLIPVTIGNLIGGAGLVGAVYWFVYLRKPRGATSLPKTAP